MIIAIGLAGDFYIAHRYISGLELGWTVVGLAGLVACASNVRSAFRDLAAQAAANTGDEATAALAVGALRSDAIRLVILSAAVSAGLIAMTVKTPDPEPPMGALGWSFVALLYVIVVGTSMNAILDERLRKKVGGILARQT